MDLSDIEQAKYIKLGEKGGWEQLCLGDGTLRLNYHEVPYEAAINSDATAIKNLFIQKGLNKGKAADHTRQVLDFYHSGPQTLWITFSGGYLWWCTTDNPVEYFNSVSSPNPTGTHVRKTLNGWSNKSVCGHPLIMRELSGQLTSVAGYRGTVCDVHAFNYLMRKIKGDDLPQVRTAKSAKKNMLDATEELIQLLTPQDFELFVDLIFSQSGWRRVGGVGGTQKTQDIELILPSTGEYAVVQVKSRTNQSELEDYIERFSSMSADKYFYAYHTSKRKLDAGGSGVRLMGLEHLSSLAMQAGLIDWLISKCG